MHNSPSKKTFLLLQGPIGSFFNDLAEELKAKNHDVFKINFWGADTVFFPNGIKFDKNIEQWEKYVASFCIKNKITDIVLFGDRRPYHEKAINAVCKISESINIWVLEEGYFRPHWVTVDQYGSNFRSHIKTVINKTSKPKYYPLPEEQENIQPWLKESLYTIFKYYLVGLATRSFYPNFKYHRIDHPLTELGGWVLNFLATQLKIKDNKKQLSEAEHLLGNHFVVALQLDTDAQIRKYSPFKNINELMELAISSFAKNAPHDKTLIVKSHPFDRNWIFREREFSNLTKKYNIEDRAAFINNCPASKITQDCQGVITANSSFALHALNKEIPVKALGDAFWNIKGVCDEQSLTKFWNNPIPPDREVFESLKEHIMKTQLNGSFYSKEGREVLLKNIANYFENTQQDTRVLSKQVQDRLSNTKKSEDQTNNLIPPKRKLDMRV